MSELVGFVGLTGGFLERRRAQKCSRQSARRTWCASTADVQFIGIQHAGMIVEDTERAKKFYMEVLGMADDTHTRPNLAFGGAFVRCGAQQVHLMELPNVDPKEGRPDHGGRDKHVAFAVRSITPLIESLEKNGVYYTMSKSGRRAVFCRDIDANALEFVEVPE